MLRQFQRELIDDEGYVPEIYMCPAGKATFGVGHMIRQSDPEWGLPVGTPISNKRILQALNQDMRYAIDDCYKILRNFPYLDQEIRLICGNMMFNLGFNRYKKFVQMKAAIEREDYKAAAEAMTDSLWHRQLPERSTRLIERMKAFS